MTQHLRRLGPCYYHLPLNTFTFSQKGLSSPRQFLEADFLTSLFIKVLLMSTAATSSMSSPLKLILSSLFAQQTAQKFFLLRAIGASNFHIYEYTIFSLNQGRYSSSTVFIIVQSLLNFRYLKVEWHHSELPNCCNIFDQF